MSAVDNLKKAVTDLQAEVGLVFGAVADLKQQVADLQTALTTAGVDNPDVQAAADAIEASVANLETIVPPKTP